MADTVVRAGGMIARLWLRKDLGSGTDTLSSRYRAAGENNAGSGSAPPASTPNLCIEQRSASADTIESVSPRTQDGAFVMRFELSVAILALASALPWTTSPPAKAVRSNDARVATVHDRQGIALVRPLGRERWTPLAPKALVLPGDQVRVPVRGANAVELRLKGGGSLLIGPGSLVGLPEQNRVRVFHGELELDGKDREFQLDGPGGYSKKAKGKRIVRSDGRTTTELAKAPRWLSGYRNSTTDEWMGSLIAKVDGRDTALTVGYHKASVEIRDQIARTTVEQSFRNTTDGTLEGIFYFPLPADASISGFGMWIGDELVEADIVEKQKARRIYEDILRRKKDPGLLEWSGGNLFKARVFPIFPHSEKRVRIRYTQVLPLEGQRLRYRYNLRSELLQQNPLRELAVDVKVFSSTPIAGIASPTHEVVTHKTESTASARFDRQEFSPKRDFELVLELARRDPLTVVPHRRADDGYFMLLLSPPGDDGKWKRELVPEGKPLDVILLCDTSASMHEAARANQAAFVESLLSQLGAKDRFRLATCDIDTRWYANEPASVVADEVGKALDFLAARDSLGWTDLDAAMQAVADVVGPESVVIYVGDGIGTTGNADPMALSQRLRSTHGTTKASFHAVSVSSEYEKSVLEAIASLGGGSVRSVDEDAMGAASALLREAASPSLKNVRVRVEGLRTARVYPEQLPNVAAGTQQIVLGRFLPKSGSLSGRVVVEGELEGKEMRFASELRLAADESGNSFVPRLWARRHIDALLGEAPSKTRNEELIGFSEEFGVMTPLTSFLVLESDADRERYGVTRRVKMRDGEDFFAEARDAATLELRREQMKRARAWRQELRRNMLRELARLGKDLHQAAYGVVTNLSSGQSIGLRGGGGGRWREQGADRGGFAGEKSEGKMLREYARAPMSPKSGAPTGAPDPSADAAESEEILKDMDLDDLEAVEEELEVADKSNEFADARITTGSDDFIMGRGPARKRASRGRRRLESASKAMAFDGYFARQGKLANLQQRRPRPQSFGFPHLAAAPQKPGTSVDPKWPAQVLEALRPLTRRAALAKLRGGLHIERLLETLHPLAGQRTNYQRHIGAISPAGWWTRIEASFAEPHEHWLYDGKRGVLRAGYRLGRERKSVDEDQHHWPMALADGRADWISNYRNWDASVIETTTEGQVRVRFAEPRSKQDLQILIDTSRGVVLEVVARNKDKVTGTRRYLEHIEVAGMWIPKRFERLDDKGRVIQRATHSARAIAEADARDELAKRFASTRDGVLIAEKDPKIDEARQAIADGKGGVIEQLVVAGFFVSRQQWKESWAAFDEAAKLIGDKPGIEWMRLSLRSWSRQGPELRTQAMELAQRLVAGSKPERVWLGRQLYSIASGRLAAPELLRLFDRLMPLADVAGIDQRAEKNDWQTRRAQLMSQLGRVDEQIALLEQVHERDPWQIQALSSYAHMLRNTGKADQAIAVLAKAAKQGRWLSHESYRIYEPWTSMLWDSRRLADLEKILVEWQSKVPANHEAWKRWLSVRMFREDVGGTDKWVQAELAKAPPKKEDDVARMRLQAAIEYALGRGWNWSTNIILDEFLPPLEKLASELIARKDRALAPMILNSNFRRTDGYKRIVAAMRKELLAEGIEKLEPAQLQWYCNYVSFPKEWKSVTERIKKRWKAAVAKGKDARGERDIFAGLVLKQLTSFATEAERIAFQRERLEVALTDERPALARDLLQRLGTQKWTIKLEGECFALLISLQPEHVGDKEGEAGARRLIAGNSLRRLVDKLEGQRYRALRGEAADIEKLSRNERRQKERDARKNAREQLAAALTSRAAQGVGGLGGKYHTFYRPWADLEVACLTAQLRKVEDAYETAATLFRAANKSRKYAADEILRERCAIVMAYCAIRREAPKKIAEAVKATFAERIAAIAAEPKPKTGDAPRIGAIDWKWHMFRLLVCLDERDAIITQLESWIDPKKVERHWRIALAYVLAEKGDLDKAVASLEAAAAKSPLDAREWKALEAWALALGDDAKRERAILSRLKATPEWQLSNSLYSARNRTRRRPSGMPEALDPQVILVERALLEKASWPQNYIWQIRQIYRQTKDHRLLEALPYGLVGHSKQAAYGFLGRVSQILREVHEEATCDRIDKALHVVAKSAKRDSDKRVTKMFRMLVARRAAEVLNAPGPHADRGLAAMRAARKGEWEKGERRQMAQFLAGLGRIPQKAFADEQMDQLLELLAQSGAPSNDRLYIANAAARTHWSYNRRDDAVDLLGSELTAARTANGKRMPNWARNPLSSLLSWLQSMRRNGRAERWVLDEVDLAPNSYERNWYASQLLGIRLGALENGGRVSLGSGRKLYDALRVRIEADLWTVGRNRLSSLYSSWCRLHTSAKKKAGIHDAVADFEAFARGRLAELVSSQAIHGHQLIGQTASCLRGIATASTALDFMIGWFERQPKYWFRIRQDIWSRHAWTLGRIIADARPTGRLGERTLAVVLDELERKLMTMRARYDVIYSQGNRWYWARHQERYAQIALKVLELRADSEAHTAYAAGYLWNNLRMRRRAIDALLAAEARGLLGERNRWTLVSWMHHVRRFSGSLPFLAKLIEARPDSLQYRTAEIRALSQVSRKDEARTRLHAAIEFFKSKKRWNHSTIQQLGATCVQSSFWKEGAELYDELIPLYQRTARNRGIGNGTLSNYYAQVSQCRAMLGQHEAAVDAASAAVVAWGRRLDGRRRAVESLRRAVSQIRDLDAFIAKHDAKVADEGLDAPLLRKTFGRVYLDRREAKKAVPQLLAARELQSNDLETGKLLLQAYDALGDATKATEMLVIQIRAQPRELSLYVELGKRLAKLGKAKRSERAWTSLVEVQPNEAESHRLLAAHREEQKRWSDAALHWRRATETRSEEPDSYLKLARAQIRAGRNKAARTTLEKILETKWEQRFDPPKIKAEASRILANISSDD